MYILSMAGWGRQMKTPVCPSFGAHLHALAREASYATCIAATYKAGVAGTLYFMFAQIAQGRGA